MIAHESLIDAMPLDQRAEHAEQKGQVAAGVHVEPMIGERRAAERAGRDRRDPVAAQARARDKD